MGRALLLALVFIAAPFLGAGACTTGPGVTGDGDGDGDVGGDGDGDGDVAGDGDGDGDTMGDGDGDLPIPPFKASTRGKLVWKRTATLEADIMGALDLEQGEVCNELGRFPCTSYTHLVALGGNEPFVKALYTPLPAPSVTTSVAIDRTVLAACAFAADRDAESPSAKRVFVDLDLDLGEVADGPAIDATVQALYRRFHARDPLAEELSELKALLTDDDGAPVSALDFAKLACFAVGTTTEMVFY